MCQCVQRIMKRVIQSIKLEAIIQGGSGQTAQGRQWQTLVEVLGQTGPHTHRGNSYSYMTCHQQPSSRLTIISTSFESTQLVLSQNFLHTKDTFSSKLRQF